MTIVASFLCSAMFLILFYTPNLYVKYAAILGYTVSTFGYVNGYILMSEVTPNRLFPTLTATMMVIESFVHVVLPPLLLYYVKRDIMYWGFIWFWLTIAPPMITCFFFPESPDLYIEKGEYDKAREVIK